MDRYTNLITLLKDCLKKLRAVNHCLTLNEAHRKEKINLYVDSRVKGMGLRLHESVLTLLRQAKSNSEVDTLIRETQDALREGLTHSVSKISEVNIVRPLDKNQADINSKVGIALKHLTGL